MNSVTSIRKRLGQLSIDAYEIYQKKSHQLLLEAREEKIDLSQEAQEEGIALQLFRGNRVGFVSLSDLTDASLDRGIPFALEALDLLDEEKPYPLAQKQPSKTEAEYDRTFAERSFKEKEEIVCQLEREARQFDRRVSKVRAVQYEERSDTVTLTNSNGFEGSYSKTIFEISLMVVAEEKGQQEMAWDSYSSPYFDKLDPREPARRAAEQAVSLLGARSIPTQRSAALLDPMVTVSFLSVLSSSFLGDQVVRGKSALQGRLGEVIYSPLIQILDQGEKKGGFASAPFDGEGTISQSTKVVDKGILKGYLFDRATAVRMNAASTGNGIRSGYKERPHVGVTNFFMEPGKNSEESLIREMGKGFWVKDVIGVHTANPVTGDFSLGAAGFWVENGEKKFPVRGVTISGNLHELLKKTVGIGSDLRFYHSYGAPSLLVSSLDIGGQ